MKNSLKHLDFLDRLRGVAILAVLLYHTYMVVYETSEAPWHGWFRDFSHGTLTTNLFFAFNLGLAGVPIFFVISGFCIHLSFNQQGREWRAFFIRRFFRIYPAYLAALILFIPFVYWVHFSGHLQDASLWQQLMNHLFLIHNFFAVTDRGINGAFWSLAIEFQLYLIYPLLMLLVARYGWRRTLLALAACEFLIRGFAGYTQTAGLGEDFVGQVSGFFTRSVLGYWFSWSLGAWVADRFLKNNLTPIVRHSPFWWLLLAFLFFFVKPLSFFAFAFFAIATAIYVNQLVAGVHFRVKLPHLPLALLSQIGLWSYSLYLLHQPILYAYKNALDALLPAGYNSKPIEVLLLGLTWLAIIPLSVLWYRIFELPGVAMGKQVIQHQPARPFDFLTPKFNALIGLLILLLALNFVVVAKYSPLPPEDYNQLAWTLATSPDPAQRNGVRAIEFAGKACEATKYQNPAMLGTLAAAYAEAGRFDDAIATAQKAGTLAAAVRQTNLVQSTEEWLRKFQAHQPYHEIK